MNQLLTDLRSGVRMLFKYPTLSLVAVLTLGLGIGLSTTVFCVVNGGLFKGLPVPRRAIASCRWSATNPSQNQPRQPISVQDLAIWQARQTSFEQARRVTASRRSTCRPKRDGRSGSAARS